MTQFLSHSKETARDTAGQPAVHAHDVGLTVPGHDLPIISGVSLDVRKGEFVALVGPSGSGKTTFLNIVAGLQGYTSGEVLVRGEPPRRGRPDAAYALARDALLPWRTARGNVELALQVRGMKKAERRERAQAALERVGLGDAADRYRSQLSQGMRQRVALARTLVTEPSFLLLDEPFAALDAQTRLLMQQHLLELLEQFDGTMLVVTHDIGEAITLADRVVVFSQRPGHVIKEYPVGFPRPRNAVELRAEPRFGELFEEIWSDISAEMKP
ncbi:ABC transporter ATP-binding protein [Amycolatopsis jejuensis]|uniref:ABC transporter ATP-binding protein n=1 Tax=Amycolatopsis jejuensis TaxID=330084 RepID=UPI0007C4EC7F|nr:ABC transporter ATP-binding protein [Amycolatopsis jejuensis]